MIKPPNIPDAGMGAGCLSPLTLVAGGVLPCTTPIEGCRPLCCTVVRAGVVALPSSGDTWPWRLSPGSDVSFSLPTILVPPHLGPGCPWEPQGAVAALPQEEPLPRGGGPCLPLLVSTRASATWVNVPSSWRCHLPAHFITYFCPSPILGHATPP